MDSKLEAQVDKGGTPSWTLSQNTTALAGKIDTPPPHERKPQPPLGFLTLSTCDSTSNV